MITMQASKSFMDQIKNESYKLTVHISKKTLDKDLEQVEGSLRGWNNNLFKILPIHENDHAARIMKSIKSMAASNDFEHGGHVAMELSLSKSDTVRLDIKAIKNCKMKNQPDLIEKDIWFRTSSHQVKVDN